MLVKDLARNLSKGKQTDLILLYFLAFDKVNHSKLMWKLHQYGIRGHALVWIRAFLGNRSQTVVREGEESRSVPVTSGVHQGSVLGPILFPVYINDLSDELSSQVRLFADDTSGERITRTVLYEETRSGENLVQLSVNYEGGLKRTDVLHLEPPKVQGSRLNRRSGGWQGTTNRFGQTLCVGGQMEHGVQPLSVRWYGY